MRQLFAVGAVALLGLSGCYKPADDTNADAVHHGRYAGVGIYPAGQMWSQVVVADSPKDPAPARTKDDDEIIVVIDSKTGELRQCGNLTGYCVGMNPWSKPLTAGQVAPAPVAKHADEIERDVAAAKPEARPASP